MLRAGSVLVLMTDLDAEPQSALTLRDMAAVPARIASYTLATLGLTLGSQDRISAITENSPALFAGVARGDRIPVSYTHLEVYKRQSLVIKGGKAVQAGRQQVFLRLHHPGFHQPVLQGHRPQRQRHDRGGHQRGQTQGGAGRQRAVSAHFAAIGAKT